MWLYSFSLINFAGLCRDTFWMVFQSESDWVCTFLYSYAWHSCGLLFVWVYVFFLLCVLSQVVDSVIWVWFLYVLYFLTDFFLCPLASYFPIPIEHCLWCSKALEASSYLVWWFCRVFCTSTILRFVATRVAVLCSAWHDALREAYRLICLKRYLLEAKYPDIIFFFISGFILPVLFILAFISMLVYRWVFFSLWITLRLIRLIWRLCGCHFIIVLRCCCVIY